MKEFKVWDTACECFIRQHMVQLHGNGSLVYKTGGYIYEGVICDYIGKTDINSEKIYADSSVVEFDLILEKKVVGGLRKGKGQQSIQKLKGWFEFNDEELRYEINILNDRDFIVIWFDIDKTQNLKIIDTIQENKLGLIK